MQSLGNDTDPAQAVLRASTVPHPAPQDQYLERSQLLTRVLSKTTQEL